MGKSHTKARNIKGKCQTLGQRNLKKCHTQGQRKSEKVPCLRPEKIRETCHSIGRRKLRELPCYRLEGIWEKCHSIGRREFGEKWKKRRNIWRKTNKKIFTLLWMFPLRKQTRKNLKSIFKWTNFNRFTHKKHWNRNFDSASKFVINIFQNDAKENKLKEKPMKIKRQ